MGTVKKIAVLISGGKGTNLRAIHEAIQTGKIQNAQIQSVVTDRGEIPKFKESERTWIKSWITEGLPDEKVNDVLYSIFDRQEIDLVCMAGFLRKIEIRPGWENKVLNIHPSLLPKYGGQGMYGLNVHKAVLEAKEEMTGCSVHVANEEYDKGPVVAQKKVKVMPDDTPETLQQRVKEAEWTLYPSAIESYLIEQYPNS